MSELHVIGAGPSGCVSAITAARKGHKVLLSEEHSVAGIPERCSGLFSENGLERLRDIVDYRKFIKNPVSGARIHFGSESFFVKAKKTMGYVCNRSLFDRELAVVAEDEGVRVEYGKRINRNFKSKNIVGADGPFSNVAKHFRFPAVGRFIGTMQTVVDYKCGEKDVVELFLSPENFPGFFGWIIPHSEEKAEMGMGVELPGDMRRFWGRFLKSKGLEPGKVKYSSAVIPAELRAKTAMRRNGKNIILVGDSAGQVKATTGGGVIFGTNCARIAGNFFTNPRRYEVEWKLRYGADLGMHRIIRDGLNFCSEKNLNLLGKRLNRLKMNEYLENYGDMDRPLFMLRPEMLLHALKAAISGS